MDPDMPSYSSTPTYSTGPPGCASNPIVVSKWDPVRTSTTTLWPEHSRPIPGTVIVVSRALWQERCETSGIDFLLVRGRRSNIAGAGGDCIVGLAGNVCIFADNMDKLLEEMRGGEEFQDWLPMHWVPPSVVDAWSDWVRDEKIQEMPQKPGTEVLGEREERSLSEEEEDQVWSDACHGSDAGGWQRKLVLAMGRLVIQ